MIARALRLTLRGLADLRRNPLAQLLTLCAVTLTAFLAGLFLLVVVNLNHELLSASGEFVFQVYWQPEAPTASVREQWRALEKLPHCREVRTYTPDQALAELGGALGENAEALRTLSKDNPLPPTAVVYFEAPEGDPETFAQETLRRLETLPGVAEVHYSALELDLAKAWVRFSHTVLWPLIALLGLIGALIVGNTLRLSLTRRRDEVEILRLVGASRWYIQFPLLIGGAAQGFTGGLLSLGMLKLVQLALADFLATPPLALAFTALPLPHSLALVAGMTLVGMLSSLVALSE